MKKPLFDHSTCVGSLFSSVLRWGRQGMCGIALLATTWSARSAQADDTVVSMQFPAYSYLNGPHAQGGANSNYYAGVVNVHNWNEPTDFPAQRTPAWSYLSSGLNLMDSTGASTGIGYTLSFNTTETTNAQEIQYGGQWPNVLWYVNNSQADERLAQGGAISYSYGTNTGTPTALTVTGMDETHSYNLIAYISGAWFAEGSHAAINLGDTTYYLTTSTNTLGAWTEATSTDPNNPMIGNYVEFTGLTGVMSEALTVTGVNTGLSGFQLIDTGVAVTPEPASLCLVLLGAPAVLARRRRRD